VSSVWKDTPQSMVRFEHLSLQWIGIDIVGTFGRDLTGPAGWVPLGSLPESHGDTQLPHPLRHCEWEEDRNVEIHLNDFHLESHHTLSHNHVGFLWNSIGDMVLSLGRIVQLPGVVVGASHDYSHDCFHHVDLDKHTQGQYDQGIELNMEGMIGNPRMVQRKHADDVGLNTPVEEAGYDFF
jgi:hypothetical protein